MEMESSRNSSDQNAIHFDSSENPTTCVYNNKSTIALILWATWSTSTQSIYLFFCSVITQLETKSARWAEKRKTETLWLTVTANCDRMSNCWLKFSFGCRDYSRHSRAHTHSLTHISQITHLYRLQQQNHVQQAKKKRERKECWLWLI